MEIYLVENIITGKFYVGRAKHGLEKRRQEHEYMAKCSSDKARLIHLEYSIRKYGKENFIWNKIFICSSEEELNEMEKFFIAAMNSQHELYNHTDGGNGGDTFSRLSDEGKLKRINNSIGKNNPMYGKSVRDVWIEKYGQEEANNKLNIFKEKCSKRRGTKHPRFKNISVEEIKKLRSQNKTMREIAKMLNCSTMVIQDRLKRKTECKV